MLRDNAGRPSLWPEGKLVCSGGRRKAKLVAGIFFFFEGEGDRSGRTEKKSETVHGNM
jgi:hypothetical protein